MKKSNNSKTLLPKLIDPGAGFNAFIGKLGDILVKAVDRPLEYAVNWGRTYSLCQYI